MANLFPVGYKNEVVVGSIKRNITGYRESISYDDELGDCVIDSKGRIATASGVEAWRQWCLNCIDTDRYKHKLYTSDFGIDYELIRQGYDSGGQAMAESIIQKEVTDALMADDYQRTESVSDFSFEWKADSVHFSCTVRGISKAEIDITASLSI